MIPRSGGKWMSGGGLTGLALALAMLAACSGEKRPATPPPPPPKAAAPGVAAGPARPEGADAVDAALTEAQLFDATATESLADVAKGEAKIRELAGKAADLTRRSESAPEGQRPALVKSLAAALAEREAAHAALGTSLDNFRTTSAETGAVVDAAVAQCAGAPPPPPTPGATPPPAPAPAPPPATPGDLAAYPGCAALLTEQAALAKSVAALSKAFESAEAAYRADRRRIEEASATLALAR